MSRYQAAVATMRLSSHLATHEETRRIVSHIHARLTYLQRTAGNAAVQRSLTTGLLPASPSNMSSLQRQPTGATAAQASDFPADERAKLARGDLKDAGRFTDFGYSVVFSNPILDRALQHYATSWGASIFEPAEEAQPAPAPTSSYGGHSEGRPVKGFPAWFSVFQSRLIRTAKWGPDELAVAALLDAYLRARSSDAPASVLEFYRHVGKSEKNKRADDIAPGAATYNWCAAASTNAVVRALHEHGYFFRGASGQDVRSQKDQNGKYIEWLTDKQHRDRQINAPESYSATLEPGDKLTILTNKSPKSGHVITVIEVQGTFITYVSGNAAEEAVRIETAIRGTPVKGFQWNVTSHKPPSGEIWTIIIEKASKLDPNRLDKLQGPAREKALDELGLVYAPAI
jgi:hypothetical protein